MSETGIGLWGVPLAILGGAIRVSTPFLFVSLGECLTERSGRINLGLEGTLVFGAMAGYAIAYETGNPWAGVLAAAIAGAAFGLVHGLLCKLPKVNDIAIGIALMLLGMGLAFFFGKPYIQPVAPDLPAIELGAWSSYPQVQAALRVNVLFVIGAGMAVALWWVFRATKVGLIVRVVGDSTDAARAMGLRPNRIRIASTAVGGASAGVAGALLFGGAGALGPALQSVGVTSGYYLFYAAPYVLTLGMLIATSSTTRAMSGAPGELSITK